MMSISVRRGIAAGLMLAALITGSVAMSGTVAAQQAGTIQTFPGPKIGDNGSGTKVSGNYVAPVAVPSYSGYPIGGFPYYGYGFDGSGFNGFGFNGFNGGFNNPYIYGFGYNAPYSGYGYGGYPFNGYGGYGYTNLSGNTIVGCTPTVSFTPAFGYGYGCQQVSQYPTAQSSAFYGNMGVAYPTVPQSPYQIGR